MARKRPFFHSAAIYQFNGRLLINPYARTRDGVRTGMAVLATASLDDTRDIGMKVLAMLEQCQDDIADDYAGAPSPSIAVILREAKQHSWKAFEKKALLVDVFRELGAPQMQIKPWRRVDRGAEAIKDKVQISGTDPEEIGQAVLRALSYAE